jgi:predicted adenylyl cyclase CyaB
VARNVEIKARIADRWTVRRRVESLGAVAAHELTQVDTFFDVSGRRLKLRQFGDGTGELISYVRDDRPGPKVSNYLVANIASPDALRDVLAHALGVRGVVRKRRTLFLFGQTRIHLDQVESLGTFVEFEVVLRDDQSESEGRRLALDLLEKLAIPDADLVAHAYIDLLQDAVY